MKKGYLKNIKEVWDMKDRIYKETFEKQRVL